MKSRSFSFSLLTLLIVLAGSATNAEIIDGGLYGLAPRSGPTAETELLLINPTNASWTVVATYVGIEFHSLEIASDGTIYATGAWGDNNLYTLDIATATPSYTSVGTFGTDLYFGGLSMSNDGTLYGSGSDLVDNDLYTLNTSTGVATSVGQFSPTPSNGVAGVSYNADGSILYGVGFNSGLYTINESTAALTSIGGTTAMVTALAIDPADGVFYGNITSQVSGAETLVTIWPLDDSTNPVGTMVVGDLTALTFANLSAVPEPSCLLAAALLFGITATRRRRADCA